MTTQAPVAPATATTTPAKEPKDYAMVAASLPLDLHKSVEDKAKEQKVSVGVLIRRFVAEVMKYDITAFERGHRKGRVKFSTPEEAAAAQKERSAAVKVLMERYNKGLITISDEEIESALATMKQRKPRAPKAATPAGNSK